VRLSVAAKKRKKFDKEVPGLWKLFPCPQGQAQAAAKSRSRSEFHLALAPRGGFLQNAMIKTIQWIKYADEPENRKPEKTTRGAQGA
jgi:hypothetical protein